MTITTYEGFVEKGKIRLKAGVHLPDHAKVYVIVPDLQVERTARIVTPRLVHRKQAADFKMKISEGDADA